MGAPGDVPMSPLQSAYQGRLHSTGTSATQQKSQIPSVHKMHEQYPERQKSRPERFHQRLQLLPMELAVNPIPLYL